MKIETKEEYKAAIKRLKVIRANKADSSKIFDSLQRYHARKKEIKEFYEVYLAVGEYEHINGLIPVEIALTVSVST